MKKALPFFLSTLVFAFLLTATPALSQDIGLTVNGQSLGDASGLGHTDIRTTAVQIINVLLSLLGIICVSLMVYAGYNWMTSGGEEDKIKTAKGTIYAAIIGLVIILSAYSIMSFVLGNSYRATTGNVYEIYP